MSRSTRGVRSWREARRLRAFELRALGWSQQQIAQALGVSQAAICQWFSRNGESDQVWRDMWRPGPARRLETERLRLLPELLSRGAEAYGFCGEVWTCGRVAAVIREEFGVLYSPSHVSRLLKALNWTPQKPIQRATQRDEVAIEHWRDVRWPELKKKAAQQGWKIVFIDESGLRLLPAVVRSYAPCGQTPILHARCSRDHLSIMAGLTLGGGLYTLVRQRALNSADSVRFLQALRRNLRSKVMVIWEGSPIHKREVRSFLSATADGEYLIESFPAYAPELSPLDACLWHLLKDVELRNLCSPDLFTLRQHLSRAIRRLRRKPNLAESCLKAASLSPEL